MVQRRPSGRFFIMLLPLAMAAVSAAPADAGSKLGAKELNPDECGAGGRGCVSAEERKWMARGYELLPNASSSTITWYANACTTKPHWRQDCERRPEVVLKRLGLSPND